MSYLQNLHRNPISGGLLGRIGINRLPNSAEPVSFFGFLQVWTDRVRVRRQLARLDKRQLRDIGVSPIEVRREIIKPFWSK